MSTCRVAEGVHWTVGRAAVTIVDPAGVASTIGYPDAAVWDFVSRGYGPGEVAGLVAAVAAIERADAEELVRSSIARWMAGGLLEQA
jgi:hypothetical protein